MPRDDSARGVEAAGAKSTEEAPIVARLGGGAGPSRDVPSAGLLARVGAELERREAEAFRLAAEFLADTAGRPEPWTALFSRWAPERGLSEDLQRLVRVAILRARAFGAMGRHAERQAAVAKGRRG